MSATRLAVSLAIAVAVAAAAFALLARGGDEDRVGPGAGPPSTDAGWSEGRRAFAAMGCGSCHELAAAGSTGRLGPSLDTALAGHDRESLARTIVRPPAGTMPTDYGERMTDAELDALVSFLLASR